MVIDPKNNVNTHRTGETQGQNNRQVANNQPPAPPHTPDKVGTPREESVVLSSQAKTLKLIEEKVSKQSNVNKERVDKIKAAIARGEYPIDYERVAEKLLEFEELFLK